VDPGQESTLPFGRIHPIERHERLRIVDRKSLEDDAVDDAEHPGGQADPEAQRQNGDECSAGLPKQPPQRQL
jgi:hypothetical protein